MILNKLIRQLLPKGRAFRFPHGGNGFQVFDALNENADIALSEVKGILNTILPDNEYFTEADASIWEVRLGMIPSSADLETRKLAIMRKLNYPGECLGRLSKSYLESQLRSAGFDVFVHQNKFPDGVGGFMVINPGDGSGAYTQHGVAEHGVDVHGTTGFPYDSVVSNHDNKAFELPPSYSNDQLRATFFIGGFNFPNSANVPAEREREFRKLILTLKAQQSVCYLLINYI